MNLRRIIKGSIGAIIIVLSTWQLALAASGTNTFTEDFIGTTYMDTTATTAAWADGSSFLHPQLTGVCAQSGTTVTKDASGNIVFAWNDWRSGTVAVYMSKFSPAGVKLFDDIKIVDGGGPKIACDSSSNIYAVVSPNNGTQVYVYKYNSSGSFLTSFRVDTDALPGSAGNQEIAIDAANNIYVVYNYLITKFNSAGTRLWGPVRANTHAAGDSTGQFNPDVAVSGSYLYASHGNVTGTGPFGLDVCRIDPATGNRLWANEINVSNGAWMRIAADSTGNLCATYSDNYTVAYKKYNSAGTLITGPLTVDNQAYCYEDSPDISIDASDNKYITYKLNDSYPAAVYKIRVQKLSAADAFVWGTSGKQVSYDNAYMGFMPVCAPTPTGGAISAWGQRMGLNGADNHDNLMANIITSAGTRSLADDFCIHNAPEYAATAQGQSLTIDTVTENIPAATLTFASQYYLFGQTGNFYLTNNGGTNWYQVTPGTKFTFPVHGSDLRFKAVFSTTTRSLNPKADAITVSYDYAPLTGDSTPPTGAPSTPTDQGAYTSAMQVTFNWTIGTAADPESGIANYFLQISTNSTFASTVYSGDVGLVTSYTFSTPIDSLSRTYYARVRVKNGAGLYGNYSGASDGITTDHSGPINSTNPPTDQGATTTSATLTFNWNQAEYSDPESGIASYILWVSTDKTFANSAATLFKGNVGKVSSYPVSGGVVGSTYYARVTAVNGAGLGDFYPAAPIYASDGITVIAGGAPVYSVTTTPYSWITTSTATGITGDDQSKLFTLPFTFNYYGTNYTQVNVCSNGFMSFVSNSAPYSPVAIPNSAQPNALLAAYWRDLNPAKAGSAITYGSWTDKFVMTWSVYNYGNTNKQTFQVIIYKTGAIVYQYQSVTKEYTTVVGIENPAGTAGVTYAYTSISNGMALKFATGSMATSTSEYAPAADFAEGESYIYPNPAKSGKKPTIHVEVGLADKVEVNIYDVAGDLQNSAEVTDAPSIVDGKYAYEYEWDISNAASGVYICRIIAQKDGQQIKITRKFAVVK